MGHRFGAVVAAGLAIATAAPVVAHHSFSAEFDPDKTAELKGKIAQVWCNNPHVRYRLHDQSRGRRRPRTGSSRRRASRRSSRSAGTRTTLKVGDTVTASGQVGRNGAKKLYVRSIVRPDGSRVATGRGRHQRARSEPSARDGGQELRLRQDAQRLSDRHLRALAQSLQLARDGRRSRAEADAVHGGRPRAVRVARTIGRTRRCAACALGLPRLFGSPYNMEIVDAGDALPVHLRRAQHAAARLDGRPQAACRHAGFVARILGRALGGQRARHRDDAPVAGLARRLGLADERRRHARRRALRATAPIGYRWSAP